MKLIYKRTNPILRTSGIIVGLSNVQPGEWFKLRYIPFGDYRLAHGVLYRRGGDTLFYMNYPCGYKGKFQGFFKKRIIRDEGFKLEFIEPQS